MNVIHEAIDTLTVLFKYANGIFIRRCLYSIQVIKQYNCTFCEIVDTKILIVYTSCVLPAMRCTLFPYPLQMSSASCHCLIPVPIR